jgi:hypothetical protein
MPAENSLWCQMDNKPRGNQGRYGRFVEHKTFLCHSARSLFTILTELPDSTLKKITKKCITNKTLIYIPLWTSENAVSIPVHSSFLHGLKELAVPQLECPSDNTFVSGHTFVLGLSETDDTFK